MLLRFSFFMIMSLPLLSAMHLKQQYYFHTTPIYSTTLFPKMQKKFILFNMNTARTHYRIKSTQLIKRFNEHNLSLDAASVRYVNFIKKSPISTTRLEQQLKTRYQNAFNNLHVKTIDVTPRSYLAVLPKKYQLLFSKNNLYKSTGIFSIKTPDKKRIFFNYRIDATIEVYMPRHPLKRGDALTPMNTHRQSILFERLRGAPLEQIHTREYRIKRSMKPGHIITHRDIEFYPIVKRGSSVVVEFKSGSVLLQFSAIASQDGVKNDIITVQKKDGRRIKARVVAAGHVEIE